MRLFYYPHAPFSRKVLLAAYEKGVPFERRLSRPFVPEEKAELKAIHPLATLPLLVDGDDVFTESSVIAEAFDLASTAGATLVPRDPRAALRVRALERLSDSHLMGPTAYLAWALRKTPETRNTEKIAAQRKNLEIALAILERELETHAFVFGDAITLADLSPVAALSSMLVDGTLTDLARWPAVAAWYARSTGRPSFQAIVEECRTVPLPPGF